MGLDLSHNKAVMTPVSPADYFTLEDLPAGFLDYGFARFVQDVPGWRDVHRVEIYERQACLTHNLKKIKEGGYRPSNLNRWLGDVESRAADLTALEESLGLNREGISRHVVTTVQSPGKCRVQSVSYYEDIVERGIYYTNAGYQRKGMDDKFYDHFTSGGQDIFFLEEDFALLESCLFPEMREQLLPNLRENFLLNFERGRSFLFVSS